MTMTFHESRPAYETSPVEPRYEFHWEQDSRRRVLMLSGVVDAGAATHLEGAIINLGSRRLVLDLSQVTSLDPFAAAALLHVVQRLGDGRVSIVLDDGSETSLALTDVSPAPAHPDSTVWLGPNLGIS